MAPQRLFGIARRWWPILLLGVLLPTIAAFLFSGTQPQVHQVSATLIPAQLRLAGDPSVSTVATSRLVGLATSYSYTAKSRELLSSIGQQLHLADGVDALSKRVDSAVDTNNAALTITARADTAPAAAALANAVAQAIQDMSSAAPVDDPVATANLATIRQRMVEAEAEYQRLLALPGPRSAADVAALGNALALLHELTDVYNSLNGSINKTPAGLVVVVPADAQLAQLIQPRTLYYTLLAAVLGLLVAAGIASILEYLDDTVKNPADIEASAELRTLGTIASQDGRRGRARIHEPAVLLDPHSSVAESYRTLRTNIEFASSDGPVRALLLTSSLPGEGTTITAANLAIAFAQAGHQVLLVDADLRKPSVHLVFDVPNAHGLTTLMRNQDVGLDRVAQLTKQANLRILTTGPLPPNPAELLGADRMRELLDRLKSASDIVILDGPPLQVVSDAAILSALVDGTLVVVAAGRSRRDAIRQSSELLANAHAVVLGAVLHGSTRPAFDRYPDHSTAIETPVVAARVGERVNPT